ncbi:hypothetical protein T06_1332 [Trichinella sp. T6]|nr:hypothetical protein T06_1332 [Trichinella sp. T6]
MFVSFVPGGARQSFSNGEKRMAPNYDCSETSNHSNG